MNHTGQSLNQYSELLANNQLFAAFRKISNGFAVGRGNGSGRWNLSKVAEANAEKNGAGLSSHFRFTMRCQSARLYTLNRVPSMAPETRESANASNVPMAVTAPSGCRKNCFTLRSRKTLGLWALAFELWPLNFELWPLDFQRGDTKELSHWPKKFLKFSSIHLTMNQWHYSLLLQVRNPSNR